MANPELATPSEITASVPDALRAELRKQLRTEIDGETLTSPQRFALEQKYGIADPVLTAEDLLIIAAEVTDGR